MPIDKTRPGYKKLLADVMRDVEGGQKCFNEKGCDHEFTRIVPAEPHMLKYGPTACQCVSKCFHKYCDKFAWVIARVEHYAEKTGTDANAILDLWESRRDYWYMNSYQDSRQPLIEDGNIKVFDTAEECRKSIGTSGFRCPNCGKVSKDEQVCSNPPCDWKAYGLFGTMGKGVKIFCKDTMVIYSIFMPVAWEEK